MSDINSRWHTRQAVRRALEAAAKLRHSSAQRALDKARANDVHPRQRLVDQRDAAAATLARRREQVAEAGRVLARHAPQQVSPAGIAMIARFEGFRSKPYRDAVGVWTIGYGETRGINAATIPWSEPKGRAQLNQRVQQDYLPPVLQAVRAAGLKLNQHELDALVSLVYNLGPGILAPGRTMGAALRSRDRTRIADAFLVYSSAGGRVLPGLAMRRRSERRYFMTGK